MRLLPKEKERLQTIKGHRKTEWLAARWLIHYMSGRKERGALLKDKFGKPFLADSPFQISISHSRAFAAAIAGPESVGIDIQLLVPKIERIAHKFMREAELNSLVPETRLEHLHVYWGAKESLYKAFGRRALDFKKHIHITPFQFGTSPTFEGHIYKDDFKASYQLWYEIVEDYVLVYAREII